jgi:methionyl-tRNA formyltransferase
VKIAFFGLPLAACLLARDGHEVVFAGLSRADGVGGRRLRRTIGEGRVVLKPKLDAALVARLDAERPDLLVSWFWTSRLPVRLVRCARLGGFGVHPSLLPRHRGPDPTTWAILSGDEETGVTAHRIAADYDTGAILGTRRVRIDPAWNAWLLARALDRPSLALLREVTRAFADGHPPAEVPQDEAAATQAPFLDDEALVIRWTDAADAIVRKVRALAPAPGARCEIAGRELVVLSARAVPAPAALEAIGEAALIEDRCLVRASDAAVEILSAESDGEALSPAALRAAFLVDAID